MIDGALQTTSDFGGQVPPTPLVRRGGFWLGSNGMVVTAIALGTIALLLIGYIEGTVLATLGIALLWGVVGGVLVTVESLASPFKTPIIRLFWVTLGMRLFVGAVLHLALSSTPTWPWWDFGAHGGDELGFWTNSEHLVSAWRDGTVFQEGAGAFVNYIAWLHILGFERFLGEQLGADSVFNAKLIVVMAGALVVPYVYLIARRLFDVRIARIAAVLAFLLPDYWFYSSTLLRDVLVSAAMAVLFYQLVSIATGRLSWWRLVFAAAINFGLIRYLRSDLALLNVGIFALFWIWGTVRWRVHLPVIRVGQTIALGLVFVVVFMFAGPLAKSGESLIPSSVTDSSYIEALAGRLISTGLEEASDNSLGAQLLQAPLYIRWPGEMGLVLLQPFPPWAAFQGSIAAPFPLKSWIVTVSGLVWMGLVAFLPVGGVAIFRGQPRRTVWVWGTVLIILMLLGFTVGAHPRWRLMFMPFALVVLAVGIHDWRRYPGLILMSTGLLFASLAFYSVLKYA